MKSLSRNQRVTGLVKRHPDGFGFFVADQPDLPDVYIPRQNMVGVMTNDQVEIEVYPDRRGGKSDRWRGEIIEVLQRNTRKVVGVYRETSEHEGVLIDSGHAWGENLAIPPDQSMNAQDGEMVAALITQYADRDQRLEGQVVQVIGDGDNPVNDILRVVHAHSIPSEFPPAVVKESKVFADQPAESDFAGRRDLRAKKLITIDGVTAKDFDDAIFVESTDKGFQLLVAIADVSHYVKEGTNLDDEAYERGTSTYFPNFVVPMLPEVLSNGLCSLNPHVPRLALVCEMHIGFDGEIMGYEFFEAVIQSHARVTYGEAQDIVDGEDLEGLAEVQGVILRAADLAKLLMGKRFKEGSLDLEIPETTVEVNDAGVPVDILRSERLFAHRLIEELMLVANICAARYLEKNEIPAMYRIHEAPDREAVALLEKYIHNFGGQKGFKGGKLQKSISRALQDFAGRPEAQILNILTLRSMNQAQYSHENHGHFGLGFTHYTHFTSPIRRYPDLIVHRLIKSCLGVRGYAASAEEKLHGAGVFLSACEQRSVKAERQVVSIKKARFMESFVGQELEGVISSVAKFGVFVLLRQYDVDGRVALEELGADRWEFDEENLRLKGRRTGTTYNIGDTLSVVVAAVDTIEGKIDFVPAGEQQRRGHQKESPQESKKGGDGKRALADHRKTDRKDDKKRRKTAKNRRGAGHSRVSKRRRKN